MNQCVSNNMFRENVFEKENPCKNIPMTSLAIAWTVSSSRIDKSGANSLNVTTLTCYISLFFPIQEKSYASGSAKHGKQG